MTTGIDWSMPATVVPYQIGVCPDGLRHAISEASADRAVLDAPHCRNRYARTECDRVAVLVPSWGAFSHTNRFMQGEACPACAWKLALERHAVDDELAAIAPAPGKRDALERLIGDPLLAVRLCRAILDTTDRDYDTDSPQLIRLLAAATAHAPQLGLPEECAEGSCDHRPVEAWDDRNWECPYPDATANCGVCSVLTGPEAGEWEGFYTPECTVAAPCSVFTALTDHYRIPCSATPS